MLQKLRFMFSLWLLKQKRLQSCFFFNIGTNRSAIWRLALN